MEYVRGSTPTLLGCRRLGVQYSSWYEIGVDNDVSGLEMKESAAMSHSFSHTTCLEARYGGVNIRFRCR